MLSQLTCSAATMPGRERAVWFGVLWQLRQCCGVAIETADCVKLLMHCCCRCALLDGVCAHWRIWRAELDCVCTLPVCLTAAGLVWTLCAVAWQRTLCNKGLVRVNQAHTHTNTNTCWQMQVLIRSHCRLDSFSDWRALNQLLNRERPTQKGDDHGDSLSADVLFVLSFVQQLFEW